jgi:hypothetical protein
MFRFTIRDLLWVMVVVALAVGWWLHYRSLDANRQAVIQHAEKLRFTLADAKEYCEDMEKNVEFALDLRKRPVKPDFSMKSRIVDWTVLDEPIPGAISN